MDHQPVLTDPSQSSGRWVTVDQAVFTSIRSPTGEGYRIIAASHGVSAAEKQAITRRAPSHGSLCDAGQDAVALLAFPLETGRYCVAHCRHAGKEHTNRGGCRVYAHFALIDEAGFEQFGCNAAAVHAAISASVSTPVLKPPPSFGELKLGVPESQPIDDCGKSSAVMQLCLAAFQQKHLLVTPSNGLALARGLLAVLPAAAKKQLAVSAGIKFAPTRHVDLCFVDGDRAALQRSIRGAKVDWFDPNTDCRRPASPFDPWLDIVEKWLNAGRAGDLDRMASAVVSDASPDGLCRIARWAANIDQVANADPESLTELQAKAAQMQTTERGEQALAAWFADVANRRAAVLNKAAAASVSAG